MKTKSTDRRILRTRQRLTNSLRELIVEKGYEHITVQDVLKRANVGRSTFYSHFESIGHLLPCEDNFRLMLAPRNGHINFLALYEHVAQNQALANALLSSSGGAIVMGHLKNVLVEFIREQLQTPADEKEKDMLFLVSEAAAAALVTLLTEWYEQGLRFTPSAMSIKSRELLGKICGPLKRT